MAQPIGDSFILGGQGRNLWRNQWEAILFSAAEGAAYGEQTDAAQIGWTSTCGRGYARFMLAVWAGRGAQAASCLVICFALQASASPCEPNVVWGGPGRCEARHVNHDHDRETVFLLHCSFFCIAVCSASGLADLVCLVGA